VKTGRVVSKIPSLVLQELARRYERSRAGRTGSGVRDLVVDYEELLATAGAASGEPRAQAEHDLAEAECSGFISLRRHQRDRRHIEAVRFFPAREAELFAALGESAPTERRAALARQFRDAAEKVVVPAEWQQRWRVYFSSLEKAAQEGGAVAPFDRDDLTANAELLTLVPQILNWSGESLIRFASCVLCGKSKRLEELEPKLARIGSAMRGKEIESLELFGIVRQPRTVLVHGLLRLRFGETWLDLASLFGAIRLSEVDVMRADDITSSAARCITIENETCFHELAKLHSGELLVQTSYPGAATRALLQRITGVKEFWHFGDSDPHGFDILRVLREQTGRPFQSLHMGYRPSVAATAPELTVEQRRVARALLDAQSLSAAEKQEISKMLDANSPGIFEQESLLRPSLNQWPFYSSSS